MMTKRCSLQSCTEQIQDVCLQISWYYSMMENFGYPECGIEDDIQSNIYEYKSRKYQMPSIYIEWNVDLQ